MKILFTGASSFSGMWFVQELAQAGHTITAIFPRKKEEYDNLRKERVENIIPLCEPIFGCRFGSAAFIQLIKKQNWDLLCHHAADVTNYKSDSFDFAKALANNTNNLLKVLQTLKETGCHKLLLTGSVFEQQEGEGTDLLRAVSPYGLSKGLTSDVFRYYCDVMEMNLGKFVIPNPFGPYEESRFTSFLAKSWLKGNVPQVSCPDYVRDNIHVSLLAKAYRHCAENIGQNPGYQKWNPSGYRENQGEFTKRFASEMEKRLSIPCQFELGHQTTFVEPKVRVNTDPFDIEELKWKESEAWDQLAHYYAKNYG